MKTTTTATAVKFRPYTVTLTFESAAEEFDAIKDLVPTFGTALEPLYNTLCKIAKKAGRPTDE